MKTQNISIPISALQFTNKDKASITGERLQMVGYSGKVIPNHFYWGNLAIDLSGMKFAKPKYPVLLQHDRSKRIGFFTRSNIAVNGKLEILAQFIDNQEAKAVRQDNKNGFPFQASIHANPVNIERLKEGEKAQCNGMTVKGPATIWRTSELRECSVCVLGYDSRTSSKALSAGNENQLSLTVGVEGDLIDEDEAWLKEMQGYVYGNFEKDEQPQDEELFSRQDNQEFSRQEEQEAEEAESEEDVDAWVKEMMSMGPEAGATV